MSFSIVADVDREVVARFGFWNLLRERHPGSRRISFDRGISLLQISQWETPPFA